MLATSGCSIIAVRLLFYSQWGSGHRLGRSWHRAAVWRLHMACCSDKAACSTSETKAPSQPHLGLVDRRRIPLPRRRCTKRNRISWAEMARDTLYRPPRHQPANRSLIAVTHPLTHTSTRRHIVVLWGILYIFQMRLYRTQATNL